MFIGLVIVLFTLAIAISASIIVYVSSNEDKIVTDEVVEEMQTKDRFTFDGNQGWWQGGTDKRSMVLFSEKNHNACFVSAEYYKGEVDIKSELNKNKVDIDEYGDGYSVKDIDQIDMSLTTTSEPVSYTLHQSEIITPPGESDIKQGQEFGYIQFEKGYVAIKGICEKPEHLSSTLPAIENIIFHKL